MQAKTKFYKSITSAAIVAMGIIGLKSYGQTVSYNVLEDDPLKYKNLCFDIYAFNVDFASPSALRAGLGAEYTFSQILSFTADAELSYMVMGLDGAAKKNSSSFEAGGVFSFYHHIKQGKAQIRMRDSHSGYIMKTNAKVLKQFGVRGGLMSFNTPKELAKTGYYAYSGAQGIYAGITLVTTKNKQIYAAGYKDGRKESRSNVYLDVMFCPVVSYSNNTDYTTVDAKYFNLSPTKDLEPLVTKNLIGFRLGWMQQSNWMLRTKQGFEIGVRPGLQDSFFFLAKFAISFGVNVPGFTKKSEETK